MTALHMAATINDVHVVDFILNSVEDPNRAVNIATNEGWTPSHFAGFLNNFDSLNLLLEHGSDLGKESNVGMSVVDEIIRVDNADLFECIFPHVKNMKRDTSKVSLSTICMIIRFFIEWEFRPYSYGSWLTESNNNGFKMSLGTP